MSRQFSWRRMALVSLAIFALTGGQSAIAKVDNPAYHNLAKINERIFFLQDSLREKGRNWLRVDSIGYSQAEHLPIYAVKIFKNVDDSTSEKPAVVYIGQVHAEEVLGVEYCLWMIPQVFSKRQWRDNVVTYVIPTVNPEGLTVVYSLDYTYRKNKRDNIGDSLFRFIFGEGMDTSGVDINRNFPLFWVHGTSLLLRGDTEKYDYYRGPGPNSEPEEQALDRFMRKVRPLYSVVLHSSRTGRVAEQVIYSWGYAKETKVCQDQDAMDDYARQVAQRCKTSGGVKRYEPVRIANEQGDCESYMYWRYGDFAIRAEIGVEGPGMQPEDSSGIYQVLNEVKLGMDYLLNSASAQFTTDEVGAINRSRFEIKVTDASQQSLEARLSMPMSLRLQEPEARILPLVKYRYTNPRNGMFFWPVMNGYTEILTVSKFGYETKQLRVTAGVDPTRVTVRLNELTHYQVNLNVQDNNGLPVTDPIDLVIQHPDSSWERIIFSPTRFDLPKGVYTLTLLSGSKFVPRRFELNLSSDTTMHVALSPAALLLNQDFDGGDIIYTTDNIKNTNSIDSLARWELTEDIWHSPPRCFTDSRVGNTVRDEDGWGAPYNMLDGHFDLSHSHTAALVYWLNQALEPGFDSMWVEISTDATPGTDPTTWTWTKATPAHQELAIIDSAPERPWNSIPINWMRYHNWERFIVPLDSFCGESRVNFRFRLRSDEYNEEDGVYLDDVQLFASDIAPPIISSKPLLPTHFTLGQPYPNPFNGRINVAMALPKAGSVKVTLFDLLGRIALSLPEANYLTGSHLITIDASSLPTGMYLMRIEGVGEVVMRKITLMK
jgi:hypothetical protein